MFRLWNFVFLCVVCILGCANPQGKYDAPAIWGGQCGSVTIDGYSYQYYWQVLGTSVAPAFSQKRGTISKDDWDYDWYVAVILVAYSDDPSSDNVPFPFENNRLSAYDFSIEDSVYSFSENAGTARVVFYSDVEGNIRKLIIDESKGIFDFFTKEPLGKATHSEVIAFWNKLQEEYDDESTLFWEK